MNLSPHPFVSVILCFHNEELFLDEAVRSVLAQDYGEWELILVDDGSSDGSTAIAKQWAENVPEKIHFTEHVGHTNQGLSASRNLGISLSMGDLIAFLDADDVWLSGKLSHQVKIFEQNPRVNVVLEASLYWNSWTQTERPDVIVPVGAHEGLYTPPELMMKLYPLGKGAAPCPSGIMVRRCIFEQYQFESSFRGIFQMYEDQAFLCKIYLKEQVFVSNACHNKYRQRPTSLVSSVRSSGKYQVVRSYYLMWFSQYLKSQGIRYGRVKFAVMRARMEYSNPVKYKLLFETIAFVKALVARVLVKLGVLKYSKV